MGKVTIVTTVLSIVFGLIIGILQVDGRMKALLPWGVVLCGVLLIPLGWFVGDLVALSIWRWWARAGAVSLIVWAVWAWWIWIVTAPVLIVTPAKVTYSEPFAGGFYTFKINNRSDDDLYIVGCILRIESPNLTENDFYLSLPQSSRKSIVGNSEQADVSAFRMRDGNNVPGLYVRIYRLAAHDNREIQVGRLKVAPAAVSAMIDFFTTEPQPTRVIGNEVQTPMRTNELIHVGPPIAFSVIGPHRDIPRHP
jgi:hypothetical protein